MSDLFTRIAELTREPHDGGLEGWCSYEKAVWLAEAILDMKPMLVVEIGVFGGRSLIPMALALRESKSQGRIVGIDPYDRECAVEGVLPIQETMWWARNVAYDDIYRACVAAIAQEGLSDCEVIRQPAHEVVDGFPLASIDLLHIDGCHSEVASCRDVELWLPCVRPGGIIVLDDTNPDEWPTVAKAKSMLARQCALLHVGEGRRWEAYRNSLR